MAAALAAAVWELVAPGATAALAAILLGVASLGVSGSWPELFEVRGRYGRRGFNGLALAPGMLLAVSALQVDLIDAALPWIAAGAGAAAGLTLGLLQMRRPGVTSAFQLVTVLALAWGAFGLGAFVVANVRFDTAKAAIVETTLTGKYASRGRSTSYHLQLPAWGPNAGPITASVPYNTYAALNPGDPVCILAHAGALGAGWFEPRPCQGLVSA
jgi:hypothetical protein